MRQKSSFLGAALMVAAVAACAATDQTSIPGDALLKDESFVPIARPNDARIGAGRSGGLGAYATPVTNPGNGDDFYLAINKKELGKRWFLSGYMRNAYPYAGSPVDMGAARSLGTRVVSFKVQNGKLFVFDVSDGKKTSDLFSPEILVEAYPIVSGYAPFEGLANHDQYVLFDAAGGMNKFALGADLVNDFFTSASGAADFTIGISFMQGFRKVDDGVTYEQVFTGQGIYDDGSGPFTYRASGTLGIGLRKYAEGDGYKATEMPWLTYYF